MPKEYRTKIFVGKYDDTHQKPLIEYLEQRGWEVGANAGSWNIVRAVRKARGGLMIATGPYADNCLSKIIAFALGNEVRQVTALLGHTRTQQPDGGNLVERATALIVGLISQRLSPDHPNLVVRPQGPWDEAKRIAKIKGLLP